MGLTDREKQELLSWLQPFTMGWIQNSIWVPAARVVMVNAQSIANATPVFINFDTEMLDTDNLWDISNPSYFTIRHPGYYVAGAGITFPNTSNTVACRNEIVLSCTGAGYWAGNEVHNIANKYLQLSVAGGAQFLNVGDTISAWVYHDHGAAKSTSGASNSNQWNNFWCIKVG